MRRLRSARTSMALLFAVAAPAASASAQSAPPSLYATDVVPVGQYPTQVRAADLNGDGRLDFATSNATSADVTVRLGAIGGFLPAVSYPALPDLGDLALADLDGDGDLDLVAASADLASGGLVVRLGDGLGGFGPATIT